MMLDIEQPADLIDYLRHSRHIAPDERPVVQVLQGGVSNKTVWVQRESGEAWVLKQALAKLRVKVDWFSDPARVHREALGMRWLAQLAPPGRITPLVFEDGANHVIAMQAVPQPHENWKTQLLAGDLDLDHITQFGQLLGQIHARSAERRDELMPLFGDRTFFESLRLEPYYAYTATQIPAARGRATAAEFITTLLADTRAIQLTLVHGDYSPKNVLVHRGQLVLLDHEVIHFGDPAFDVGFSMTHLLSKAHHLQSHRATFLHAAEHYWHTYSALINPFEWATALEPRAVRHTLACMLARVAGRSPLEYLDADERAQQQQFVLALMADAPTTMPMLLQRMEAVMGNR